MNTLPAKPQSSCKSRAFTRTELLVLVALVGLLAVVRLSAGTTVRNQAKIVQCNANLRQLGQCVLLYAADYSGGLPFVLEGAWPWDFPNSISDQMIMRGATRNTFYDPGFPEHNSDANWHFTTSFREIGYAYTFPGAPGVLASEQITNTAPFQPVSGGYKNPPTPVSQRVLFADATLSTTTDRSGNFTSIYGAIEIERSPHLDGFVPAGGNVVMLDGHVDWRPFSQMSVRSRGPYFWW
jgi:prepilin-type processing-associated H-X9-DG protein